MKLPTCHEREYNPHMGKNKQPDPTREVLDDAARTIAALPADFDPFAVFSSAPSVALLDPGYDPTTHTEVVTPTIALPPVEEFIPDMADPRVRALYVNQSLDRPLPREDADPLDVRLLQLLDRLHHGGLVNPFASEVRQDLRDLIPLLRSRVCQTPTTTPANQT